MIASTEETSDPKHAVATSQSDAPRVLMLRESGMGLIGNACYEGFAQLGCEVTIERRDDVERLDLADGRFDIVFTEGPHTGHRCQSGMRNLYRALSRCPKDRRPFFAWLLYENLLDLSLPITAHRLAGASRLAADRVLQVPLFNRFANTAPFNWGHRARILAEVVDFHRSGMLSFLGHNSGHRRTFLRKLGIESQLVPTGYGKAYGEDRGLERTTDVMFLGVPGKTHRRRQMVEGIRQGLSQHGIELSIRPEKPGTRFGGEERIVGLNQTRILLNPLAKQTDMTGERLMLGMANKALIVSEPIIDPSPFVPGEHFVVAEPGKLVETVMHYLDHESERKRIVDNAYRFVTEQLTMRSQCQQIVTAFAQHQMSKQR